ncbi:MAG TPA: DUF3862 domain-containing protein [Blastocatellia bacterium]|nr:DUF3862 domain-containing protein [Blastocatellia bacterium]
MTPNKIKAQKPDDADHGSRPGGPQAGSPKRIRIATPFGFGLLVLAGVLCVGIGLLTTVACSQRTATTSAPSPSPVLRTGVTLQDFEKLQTGMSYQEVTEILGSPSKEIRRSETTAYTTVTYLWGGDQAGSVKVVFQDDKLIEKSQYGL